MSVFFFVFCFFAFFLFDAIVTHLILQNILWLYQQEKEEVRAIFFVPVAFAVQPFRCYSLSYSFPFSSFHLLFFFFNILIVLPCVLHHISAVKWPNVKGQTMCVWDISCWFSGTLAWRIAQLPTTVDLQLAAWDWTTFSTHIFYMLPLMVPPASFEANYCINATWANEKMNEFHIDCEVSAEMTVWQIVGLWNVLIDTLLLACFFRTYRISCFVMLKYWLTVHCLQTDQLSLNQLFSLDYYTVFDWLFSACHTDTDMDDID